MGAAAGCCPHALAAAPPFPKGVGPVPGTVYLGLTGAQRDLRDRVCAHSCDLAEQLQALSRHGKTDADPVDVAAVRQWLWAVAFPAR